MRPIPPPPVLVVLIGAFMWLTARHGARVVAPWPGRVWLAAALVGAGLVLGALALQRFHRAGTTVNPMCPASASALVQDGIYRYSRNPMYLADVLFLLAWTVHLGAPVNLFFVALFVWLMNRFQIAGEEAALEARFGDAYRAYRARVRRWL